MVGDCCLGSRSHKYYCWSFSGLGFSTSWKKEHKDKDKNSRTQESCPIIMLVDVDPGQVLPVLALPHTSSSCWSCFWPRQEDWWLGPVRWHQSSRAHHAHSRTLSLLLASSFQVNTEHTVIGVDSERLCGWLSAPRWRPSSASSPSFTSPLQNTKVSKTSWDKE